MPVTEYERATLVSYAAGLDPARLSAASNMPAQIAALWNPTTGSFGDPSSNGTAFAILALASTPLPNWGIPPDFQRSGFSVPWYQVIVTAGMSPRGPNS